MSTFYGVCFCAFLVFVGLFSTSGCASRKVTSVPPTITLQTDAYIVVQTSPNNFTVLTRSKAAMEEITRRLGCNKQHICSNEWDGEIWTIQRLK